MRGSLRIFIQVVRALTNDIFFKKNKVYTLIESIIDSLTVLFIKLFVKCMWIFVQLKGKVYVFVRCGLNFLFNVCVGLG